MTRILETFMVTRMRYTRHVSRYVLWTGALAMAGAAMRWPILAGLGWWAGLIAVAAVLADGVRALVRQ